MAQIDRQTSEIRQAALTYEADHQVRGALRRVTLVPLIGVFAVGKTAIMESASSLDSDFGRVRSFTTREPREGEDTEIYDFLPHNEETLDELLQQIARRELVQFTVHPTTGRIYGSRPQDYMKPYAMLDTMPTSLPNLYRLPFMAVRHVAVVSLPEDWLRRLSRRKAATQEEDVKKRLREGISSLEWCIAHAEDLMWLNNSRRSIAEAAGALIRMVKQGENGDCSVALEIGRSLLETLQEQAAHY